MRQTTKVTSGTITEEETAIIQENEKIEALQKQLNLSNDQKEALQSINQEAKKEIKKIKEAFSNDPTNIKAKNKLKMVKAKAEQEIMTQLSIEQFAVYQELQTIKKFRNTKTKILDQSLNANQLGRLKKRTNQIQERHQLTEQQKDKVFNLLIAQQKKTQIALAKAQLTNGSNINKQEIRRVAQEDFENQLLQILEGPQKKKFQNFLDKKRAKEKAEKKE